MRGRKGTYQAVFEEIRKAGFIRARVDGTVHYLDDEIELDRYKHPHHRGGGRPPGHHRTGRRRKNRQPRTRA
ncbi:MAG: hypothetical protein MZV64_17730 [Ignavibacteriales bacterium]|nr:hypothetical protein [Ignavibacteriales bacterium]